MTRLTVLCVGFLLVALHSTAGAGEPRPTETPPEPTTPVPEPEAARDAVTDPGAAPIPDLETELASQVELAQRLGAAIFIKARIQEEARTAAAAVVDRRTFERARRSVVVSRDDQWRVYFLGGAGDDLLSYYEVGFSTDGTPRVEVKNPPRRVSGRLAALYRAKQLALREMPFRCGGEYRAVAMSSFEGTGWTVYLLASAPENEPGAVAVGGHLRAEVDRDGETVEMIGALTRGCAISRSDDESQKSLRDRAADERRWIMHTSSPTPHEGHVFLSLWHEIPFYIGTWQGAWSVGDGEIDFAFTWEESMKRDDR